MFRESPPEVSAVSDHCDGDGDIKYGSEEDPAAPTVDVSYLRRRRSVLVPQIDPSVPQPVVKSRRRPLLGPSPG